MKIVVALSLANRKPVSGFPPDKTCRPRHRQVMFDASDAGHLEAVALCVKVARRLDSRLRAYWYTKDDR